MSIRLMSHVWMMDLHSTDKMVLLALADAANDSGVTWIATTSKREDKQDLVRKTSLTDRTIGSAMKRLEDDHHLTRDYRPGRGTIYKVHPQGYSTAENAPKWAGKELENLSGSPEKSPKTTTDAPERASTKPSTTPKTSEANASSGTETKLKKSVSKMHLVPDEWIPSASHREKVEAFGWPDGIFEEQLERFREHEFAVGKTDFDRAFHRWLRTCNDDLKGRSNGYRSNRTGAGPGPGRGPASSGERLDAMREGAMGAVDRFQREGR